MFAQNGYSADYRQWTKDWIAAATGPTVRRLQALQTEDGFGFRVYGDVRRESEVEVGYATTQDDGALSFTTPVSTFSTPDGLGGAYHSYKIDVGSLLPKTRYYYKLRTNGVLDTTWREIKTFPVPGDTAEVRIVYLSCADLKLAGGDDVNTADKVAELKPDLVIITGDWYYSNNSQADLGIIRRAQRYPFLNAQIQGMYNVCGVLRMYDDHDMAADNCDVNSYGGLGGTIFAMVRSVSDETEPHFTYADGGVSTRSLAQAFTIGRLRFIGFDTRSERSYDGIQGTSGDVVIGTGTRPPGSFDQEQWCYDEIDAAASDPDVDRLMLISPTGITVNVSGAWTGYAPNQYARVVNYVIANDGGKGFWVTGDYHMTVVADAAGSKELQRPLIISSPFWNATNVQRDGYTFNGEPSQYLRNSRMFVEATYRTDKTAKADVWGRRKAGWESTGDPSDTDIILKGSYEFEAP